MFFFVFLGYTLVLCFLCAFFLIFITVKLQIMHTYTGSIVFLIQHPRSIVHYCFEGVIYIILLVLLSGIVFRLVVMSFMLLNDFFPVLSIVIFI